MIYISHRGYVNGVDEKLENNPTNVLKLLEKNIHVESRHQIDYISS